MTISASGLVQSSSIKLCTQTPRTSPPQSIPALELFSDTTIRTDFRKGGFRLMSPSLLKVPQRISTLGEIRTDSGSATLWREMTVPSSEQLYFRHISAESQARSSYTAFLRIFSPLCKLVFVEKLEATTVFLTRPISFLPSGSKCHFHKARLFLRIL